MNWYYAKDKVQLGPVNDAALDELLKSGTISPTTLVWTEGMDSWKPYSTVRLSPPALVPVDQAVCVECKGTFPKTEMIRQGNAHVCASCKPAYLQKLSEGIAVDTLDYRYAGFWIRVLAKLVDGTIFFIALGIPMMVILFAIIGASKGKSDSMDLYASLVQVVFNLIQFVFSAGYSIFFIGKYGATPGKMICGIKVVDSTGAKIGYGRATGRFFAEILSALICYIGYIMVAFDPEKRALHDRICNTLVIYK